MTDQIIEDFQTLSTQRILFGHQSVGRNILSGIDILKKKQDSDNLRIVEPEQIDGIEGGYFAHFNIGENTQPLSKFSDFEGKVASYAENIDFALFKLCYIDLDRNSDVDHIFEQYELLMTRLIKKYPEIIFLHTTAPLRHCSANFGVFIRELLGRPNNSKQDNIKRNDFNKKIRQTYSTEKIIDLAEIESTSINGRHASFKYQGIVYDNLLADYTSDGGHLNENGQTHVASSFITSIAKIVVKQTTR